jgi:hypothetical protein
LFWIDRSVARFIVDVTIAAMATKLLQDAGQEKSQWLAE